jgi:hypothetical protein
MPPPRLLSVPVPKNNRNKINYNGVPSPMHNMYRNLLRNQNNSNSPKSASEIKKFFMAFKGLSPRAKPRTLANVFLNAVYVKYPGILNRNAQILAIHNNSKEHRKRVKETLRRYKKYKKK